jgi:hypothetical protein
MISKVAVVFNDANVAHSSHQYIATGMPTEAALKVNIAKTYTCYSHSTIFTISEYLSISQLGVTLIHQLQIQSIIRLQTAS